jgi:RNA polymerase sigma factor (sigma-70 family)
VSQSEAYEPDEDRWSLAWQHRGRLLRIARRRTASEQEAEDVVSEVLLRAAAAEHLPRDALGPWLTTVTLNVCADMARERARTAKRVDYSRRHLIPDPSPEQQFIDRETAALAVRRLSRLPARQREVLLLRSAGFGIAEIAEELSVSYKTAESLLSRARAFMRKTVTVVAGALLALIRSLRRPTKGAATVATVAAVVAVFISVIPSGRPASRAEVPNPVFRATHPVLSAATSAPTTKPARPKSGKLGRPRPPQRRPSPAAQRPLIGPARISAGKPFVQTPPMTYDHRDESLLETTRRCIRERPRVSKDFVGCPR